MQGKILCTVELGILLVTGLNKIASCTPKVTQPVKSRDQTDLASLVHASLFSLTSRHCLRALAWSQLSTLWEALLDARVYVSINKGLISCKGQLCNIVYVFATPV